MIDALRIRDFRLLWFGSVVSLLGSWLLVVAIPAYVYELTGSVAATGLTLAAEFLPPALLGPVAGVLADRCDRRRAMIAADLLRTVAVVALLLARDPGDVWLVYLAVAVENVGTVVFRPAAQAHIPVVVGTGPALGSANALQAAAEGVVRLVGAPLGGVLFTVAGFDLLIWLDASTYLLSAVAILLTATASSPRSTGGMRQAVADIADGLRFLRAQRTPATLLLVNTLFLGGNAVLTTLVVPYGVDTLGGSAATGLLMSALGVGFLLGAPLIGLLLAHVPPAYQLGGTLTVTGFGYAALFTPTTLPVTLAAAVLLGMAGSMTLGSVRTLLQRVTPNEILGRISAAMFTAEAVATLAGAITGPAVAGAMGITPTSYITGTATLLVAALAVVLLPRRSTPTSETASGSVSAGR